MAAQPTFISRQDAEDKINRHWQDAREACRRVGAPEPSVEFDRARNYEIEEELARVFGGDWCVSEWCPFNGWLCKWSDHCPRDWLEGTRVEHIRRGYAGVVPLIDEKIAERFG